MAVNINVPSQVKTYANLAAFPATGALKTIYIAEDTNKTYRWTGSVYTEISASAAMTWGAIGGTLSNQTDLQSALNAKENTITAGTTSQYFRGDKTFQTLDKSAVGLGNVDNTSDLNKPISTATQTALNAKQDSLGFTPVPTSRTLTINGVTQDLSANRTFTISTGITIGSTAIASGTVGRILFEGAGNVVQESSSLFWDATNNRLGIGTSTPAQTLDIVGSLNSTSSLNGDLDNLIIRNTLNGAASQTRLRFYNELTPSTTTGGVIFYTSNAYSGFPSNSFGFWNYNTNGVIALATNNTERFRIFATGNVSINTTTDAGFRLDVNGTARVQGNATIGSTSIGQTQLNIFSSSRADLRLKSSGSSDNSFSLYTLGGSFGSCYAQFGTNDGENAANQGGAIYTDSRTGIAPPIRLLVKATGTLAMTNAVSVFNTANVGINTTTDAGFRLDVNGTARINGDNTIIGLSSVNQLSFRLGVVSNQGVSTRNGDFTIGLSGATSIDGGRFYNNGTGIFWIDGFTEGASKAQNYPIVIGSRGSATGSSVGSYTTQENGSQTYFGFYAAQPSAQVIINSTTRGFLPPRMTTTQKNAIATPATGLVVYDTTLNKLCVYTTAWETVTSL